MLQPSTGSIGLTLEKEKILEGLFSLLLFAGLFFFMMRFGCGAHMHEQLRTMQEGMKQMRDMGGMKTQTGTMGIAHDEKQGG